MACVLGQGRAVTYHLGIVRVTALHAKFLAIGPVQGFAVAAACPTASQPSVNLIRTFGCLLAPARLHERAVAGQPTHGSSLQRRVQPQ